MRWLASINLLLFLSGLVKAGDWEDTGKGGRWLVRRNRAAEEEELSRRKRDAELDEDEDEDEDEEDVSHEEEEEELELEGLEDGEEMQSIFPFGADTWEFCV